MIRALVARSVVRKFLLAGLATTLVSVLVAGLANLVYDVQDFRQRLAQELESQAGVLAQANAAPLEFNDPRAAADNLRQLGARPDILAAAIFTPERKLFAHYGASAPHFPAGLGEDGRRFEESRISLLKRIQRGPETIGYVFLQVQYPLAERVARGLAVLGGVMGLALIVAAIVAYRLQAAVSRPVLALTQAVREVVARRDFSQRVPKTTEDEIGVLVDAFNTMLSEVGAAEAALKQLNSTLEERVAARTAELAAAGEQLRQSQKMDAIGQLTGGVAHDFNNVLQVVSANLQLLELEARADPATRQRIATARFAAERGAKLAAQLLAFARRQPLQPVSVNLSRILRGMDDMLRRALGESVQIEVRVADGLWHTLADPHQLESVILNLAINARDAMAGRGRLELALSNALLEGQEQCVLLSMRDSGCGMTPAVLARAFEPFFTTKAEGAGTGLGLSMAYGFAKQSNGHIEIDSAAGAGATVLLYLPRSFQGESAPLAGPSAGPVQGGSEIILVVEDDLAVQATAVDVLCALGYRVLKAGDGASALQLLESGMAVDLLFSDVVMPGPVSSAELARQAKLLLPELEVLFTSGYPQDVISQGGRLAPDVHMISKPYKREDLARKLRQLLGPGGAQPAPAPGLRILLVEDHPDNRAAMCELLDLLGHSVAAAEHAAEAQAWLERERFDVLLTDLSLPGMSGLDLARAARQHDADLRIILCSGYGHVVDPGLQCTSLAKPVSLEQLQAALA